MSNAASLSGSLIKSSNFQRYVPSPNVPSTADINSKFLSAKSKLDSYMTLPRRASGNSMTSSWDAGATNPSRSQVGGGGSSSINNKSWSVSFNSTSAVSPKSSASKVAKFCHECGNPFAHPDIRFCCECGVKRLYCWSWTIIRNSVTRLGDLLHFGQQFKAFRNNSKPLATINLPKFPTFLGNFCKGVNIIHFSGEFIFGQLL